jgi:hypothetical protein
MKRLSCRCGYKFFSDKKKAVWYIGEPDILKTSEYLIPMAKYCPGCGIELSKIYENGFYYAKNKHIRSEVLVRLYEGEWNVYMLDGSWSALYLWEKIFDHYEIGERLNW